QNGHGVKDNPSRLRRLGTIDRNPTTLQAYWKGAPDRSGRHGAGVGFSYPRESRSMEIRTTQEIAGPSLSSANLRHKVRNQVVDCRRCPRLVRYREEGARKKRKEYLGGNYWGKPVPGFGDPNASLLIVGLAPAAH